MVVKDYQSRCKPSYDKWHSFVLVSILCSLFCSILFQFQYFNFLFNFKF